MACLGGQCIQCQPDITGRRLAVSPWTDNRVRVPQGLCNNLSGQDNIVAKKTSEDGRNPIMIPLYSLLLPERNNDKKILEATMKIIELLTGEVPIRCQDVSMKEWRYKDILMEDHQKVTSSDGSSKRNPPERCLRPLYSRDSTQEHLTIPYHGQSEKISNIAIKEEVKEEDEEKCVMEEREYLEGHRDLYKDVMMENEPPLTSSDGSSKRNPPERCPRPLYSRDSTQEDHTVPHHGQSGKMSNVSIKKEIKEEEEEEEDGVMKELDYLEGHRDLYKDVMMENEPPLTSPDGSSKRNPPERCPRPLYSRDSTQEHHEIPHQDQGEKVFTMKTEVNVEEETHVRGNQLSMKEAEMMVTITKEESSLDISTGGHKGWNTPEGRLPLSTDYNKEDNGMAQYFPEASTVTQNLHHKLNPTVKSTDQQIGLILWHPNINHMPLSQMSNQALIVRLSPSKAEETSPSDSHPFQDCEKCLGKKHDLVDQKRIHTREKPFSCPECKKSFMNKTDLVRHQRVHTGEKPFSCSECGKCFSDKGNRDKHMRIHTGEKPFSCPECGKRFAQKVTLTIHQKIHARRLLYREYTPPEPT